MLARLVAAKGAVVPVSQLVEDVWQGESSARSGATLQTILSSLRRVLEPDRPPRSESAVLVTTPPGYALRLPDECVDAWQFEALAASATAAMAENQPQKALTALSDALSLWRGPSYSEFENYGWAATEVERLGELHRLVTENRAAAQITVGDYTQAILGLTVLTREYPLREEAWRLLTIALYRSGRQGDALAALGRGRAALRDQLGVDLGPVLQQLEADILAQEPNLAGPPVTGQAPAGRELGPSHDLAATAAHPERRELFVGREWEVENLLGDAAAVEAGRPMIALLTGEAGMGKTTLATEIASHLKQRGWLTTDGHSSENAGAPAGWAWAGVLAKLAQQAPPDPVTRQRLRPLLDVDAMAAIEEDASQGRFLLHCAVADYLRHLAERRPVLIVLDDLHWADEETLALLTHLPELLTGARVLMLVLYRPGEGERRVDNAIGALARHVPDRIELAGLDTQAIAKLVGGMNETEVTVGAAGLIAARTGGNPLFVREMSRMLDLSVPIPLVPALPAGIRDVLRQRIGKLPEGTRSVLRVAAVVGPDIDVELLCAACDIEPESAIAAIEETLAAGLLIETDEAQPRFAHALIRDTLLADISMVRRARIHARIADALERIKPHDSMMLAYHHTEADARSAETVHYSRTAAEISECKFAFARAARFWGQAILALESRPGGGGELRLELIVRRLRALALDGKILQARAYRAAVVREFRESADPDLLGRLIVAVDVPMFGAGRLHGGRCEDVLRAIENVLKRLSEEDSELRVRLLTALALELHGESGERGAEASIEAIAAARRLGRPDILAVSLHGRYFYTFRYDDGLHERREIGLELLAMADETPIGVYETFAHSALALTAFGRLELPESELHMKRARALAQQNDLRLMIPLDQWHQARLRAVTGDYAGAERLFMESIRSDHDATAWDNDKEFQSLAWLAIVCLRIVEGRIGELTELLGEMWDKYKPLGITASCYALALAASDRASEARSVVAQASPIRRDYFYDTAVSMRALVTLALEDRAGAAETYGLLLPYRSMLVGGNFHAVVLGPVDQLLGDLARFLGEWDTAAAHYAEAERVAAKVGADQWIEQARSSLKAVGDVR